MDHFLGHLSLNDIKRLLEEETGLKFKLENGYLYLLSVKKPYFFKMYLSDFKIYDFLSVEQGNPHSYSAYATYYLNDLLVDLFAFVHGEHYIKKSIQLNLFDFVGN